MAADTLCVCPMATWLRVCRSVIIVITPGPMYVTDPRGITHQAFKTSTRQANFYSVSHPEFRDLFLRKPPVVHSQSVDYIFSSHLGLIRCLT